MSNHDSTFVKNYAARLKETLGTGEPAEIARLLGITYQAAKNYLEGRLPSAEVLITIAEKTDYSLNWLLTGTGAKKTAPLTGATRANELKEAEEGEVKLLIRRMIREELSRETGAPVIQVNGKQKKKQA